MEEEKNYEKEIEELVLLLLYLTSWEEDIGVSEEKMKELGYHKLYRAWKGYPFDILDKLRDKELISGTHKTKSVYIKPKGVEKAKELIKKYLKK